MIYACKAAANGIFYLSLLSLPDVYEIVSLIHFAITLLLKVSWALLDSPDIVIKMR